MKTQIEQPRSAQSGRGFSFEDVTLRKRRRRGCAARAPPLTDGPLVGEPVRRGGGKLWWNLPNSHGRLTQVEIFRSLPSKLVRLNCRVTAPLGTTGRVF